MKRYDMLLGDKERTRLIRLATENLRREYLLTRALCRIVLSRYVNVTPIDWVFETNTYGRPRIVAPAVGAGLNFNLSHAGSIVVMAVMRQPCEIGIDVEEADRKTDLAEISNQCLSHEEMIFWRNLPPEQKRQYFFELWTLKEAYVKARGLGLSIPLTACSVRRTDLQDFSLYLAPELGDCSENWRLAQHWLDGRYSLAWCVRRNQHSITAIMRETIPDII
jgi:4'-phosphopantetheinyl transferase